MTSYSDVPICTWPDTTFPFCLPAFYALAIPVSCYITLVLVCCVCFLTLAGKTIIVYTAILFAQERKDLTTFASSALTTGLCSVEQTLNCVNGLARNLLPQPDADNVHSK